MQDNLAVYNDSVPLVYGTAWYYPPIVFARNDGNLTRMEVLLGMGEIDRRDHRAGERHPDPARAERRQHDGDGMVQLVTTGTRNGAFDLNFTDASGNPLGDPYGSMAMMSVVVPNAISDGTSLPTDSSADQRAAAGAVRYGRDFAGRVVHE